MFFSSIAEGVKGKRGRQPAPTAPEPAAGLSFAEGAADLVKRRKGRASAAPTNHAPGQDLAFDEHMCSHGNAGLAPGYSTTDPSADHDGETYSMPDRAEDHESPPPVVPAPERIYSCGPCTYYTRLSPGSNELVAQVFGQGRGKDLRLKTRSGHSGDVFVTNNQISRVGKGRQWLAALYTPGKLYQDLVAFVDLPAKDTLALVYLHDEQRLVHTLSLADGFSFKLLNRVPEANAGASEDGDVMLVQNNDGPDVVEFLGTRDPSANTGETRAATFPPRLDCLCPSRRVCWCWGWGWGWGWGWC